jgi:DNA-binding LacI/PurR family transcriptional regulator
VTSRLRDIGAVAGVSEATVSRVINERPGVAPSTRERVLTAVDRLGYDRPSRLRRKSAGLIGVIAPELTNPIFPLMAQVIESKLVAKGFTPVLCTQTQGHMYEEDYVEMLLERGVAGIIFISGVHTNGDCDPGRYNQLRDRGVPVVLVNGYLPGVDAAFVSNDDSSSIDLAVGHLVDLRHRRIGLAVGPERYTPVIRKVARFHEAITAMLGVREATDLIEHASFTVEGGGIAAAALVDHGVTGIVCGSDLMALGAVRAIRARGLDVPSDVSVIGFDDSPLMDFTDPPLTTVRQNVGAITHGAVKALLTEVTGGVAPHTESLVQPELVVRRSTARAARRGRASAPRRPAGSPTRQRLGEDAVTRAATARSGCPPDR